MSYRTYDSYKDSNINWVGHIPIHWELKKLKYFLNERNEKNNPIKTDNILSLTASQGVIPYSEKESAGGNKPKDDLTKYKLTYPNDIVMNSMNIISGSVGLSNYFGCVSPVYYMFYSDNEKININYYNYIFQSNIFQRSLLGLGNGILIKESESGKLNTIRMRIPIDKFNQVLFPIPTIQEQEAIVNFLDNKFENINDIISSGKQLISLLEEKKVALINQIVTKGLNTNVYMKSSELSWAKLIPEDWEVVLAKRFCNIETGGTPKREKFSYWDKGTINWITSSEVNQEVITETKNKITEDGLNNSNAHILPKNAIVMALSGQGQTKGRVAILNVETCCSQSVGALICDNKHVYYKYLFYYLKSRYYDIRGLVGNNLRDGLSLSIIGNFPILLPSFEEQISISKFLDEVIPHIDDVIFKVSENIELLEEYKASLIYHVVTGKIDVRDEV